MISQEEKSKSILLAEKKLEQAKAQLQAAKRDEAKKMREIQNRHKYMMGGIVHKYFPDCYKFDEQELNRILAAAIKSEQCQSIIKLVRRDSEKAGENTGAGNA